MRILTGFAHRAELFMRIVDKRAQAAAALLPYLGLEKAKDLFQYNAGAVIEYMPHGGVFTVQIADKMLGAHRQGKYRAQINYLRANSRLVGIFFRQQLKIFSRKLTHMYDLSYNSFYI